MPLFAQDFVLYAMFTLKYQKGSEVRVPLFEQGLVLYAMITFEVSEGVGGACAAVCARLSAVCNVNCRSTRRGRRRVCRCLHKT